MTRLKLFYALLLTSISFSCFSQTPKPSSGIIKHYEAFSSKYVNSRNIDVWLPQGYDPKKKYSVIYMNDGQMLFDSSITWNKQEWNVDETVTSLIKENSIKECIVVGIWNGGANRGVEYFPEKIFNAFTQEYKDKFLAAKFEGNNVFSGNIVSDNYLKFLVNELKPFIDSTFSVKKDQQNTFIAGSSYGGLISLYAICEYPKVFGGAACLSTHFIGLDDNDYVPEVFQDYLKQNLPNPKNHKLYFDYGTKGWPDSLYKKHQLKIDSLIKTKNYDKNNFMSKEFVGDEHKEFCWSKRLYIPLTFLLSGNDK